MKKVLLGLAALLVSANLFAGEFVIKGGLDLNQDTKVKSDDSSDSASSESTFTLQGEYYGQINKNIFIDSSSQNNLLRVWIICISGQILHSTAEVYILFSREVYKLQ